MKGIILSGGLGTRLSPVTRAISKQLLPVFDKPMIYYPLSTLMLMDITEIAVITTPHDLTLYQNLLGDGKSFGVNLTYLTQEKPRGLAEALILGEEFLNGEDLCLILGDNLFVGSGLSKILGNAKSLLNGAVVFSYEVDKPQRYGVLQYDSDGDPIAIIEKPSMPPSNDAVTGLYLYNNEAVEVAKNIKPSARGEYEITDVNNHFFAKRKMSVQKLGRGFSWLDAGTHKSLLDASMFIYSIETRQRRKIACLEEIAFAKGWISSRELNEAIERYGNTEYASYLKMLDK